jgi:hypothetical protein
MSRARYSPADLAEWADRIYRRIDAALIAEGHPPICGTPWDGDTFEARAKAAKQLHRHAGAAQ